MIYIKNIIIKILHNLLNKHNEFIKKHIVFIDIPDDNKVYHKWLVCDVEYANQFVKYLVLPCDYFLHWVENDGQNRYKRSMWVVLRNQNSYVMRFIWETICRKFSNCWDTLRALIPKQKDETCLYVMV